MQWKFKGGEELVIESNELNLLWLQDGEDGTPGTPGKDGQVLYTWMKYSHNADGSVEVDYRAAYEFVATKNLDTEQKKELTKWVIDNIDEDMIRTWLDKKHMNN